MNKRVKREIWLTDPVGGGIIETPGMLQVLHKNIRVIATVDTPSAFDPGELRCTQMALDKLGGIGVKIAFYDHLSGVDWSDDPEDRKQNQISLTHGGTMYNLDSKRRIMIITYAGRDSTLIDSSEY